MKHTPAPWYYARTNENTIAIRGKTNTGESIAKLTHPFMDDEGLANAALISAAPDLLDALKALVSIAEATHGAHDRVEKALAAIRKAEGE